MSKHAIVVGGGIIGLSCAWELQRNGWKITVLDAAPEAREASWAAAGMLAPHHEADAPSPLWHLGIASLTLWQTFIDTIRQSSNNMDLHLDGGLIPILDDHDATDVNAKVSFLRAHNVALQELDAEQIRKHEPNIAPSCRGGVIVPGGQVNPRLVCQALSSQLIAAGAAIRYHSHVTAIQAGRVTLHDGEIIHGDEVIIAAGAWTPQLAQACGVDLNGEPVKGQMLRFGADDGVVQRFIHCRHAYLVPRRGLGIVVGATMVRAGFDRQDDPEAIAQLAAGAQRVLPVLQDAPILEHWTGLRPRLASGLPIMGRIRPGLILATGHFRNGILLAPITAVAIHSIVDNLPPPCDLAPYAPPTSVPA